MTKLAQCDARPSSNCRNAKWCAVGNRERERCNKRGRHGGTGVPREEGTREQGRETRAKTGRTVRRAAFPRFPLRGLGSRSSRDDSSPEAQRKSRQTVRGPLPQSASPNRTARNPIPSPRVRSFPLRGGWWAVARDRTNRSSCKCKCRPGIREPPPSDLQKCTFRPSMPLILFLLPSSWVSGSAQVCNRHLPPRKIQAAPSKTRRPPRNASTQSTPTSLKQRAPRACPYACSCSAVQWIVGAGTLCHPFSPLLLSSSHPISILIVQLHRAVLLSACHDLSSPLDSPSSLTTAS